MKLRISRARRYLFKTGKLDLHDQNDCSAFAIIKKRILSFATPIRPEILNSKDSKGLERASRGYFHCRSRYSILQPVVGAKEGWSINITGTTDRRLFDQAGLLKDKVRARCYPQF